jgi:hypothetical protein
MNRRLDRRAFVTTGLVAAAAPASAFAFARDDDDVGQEQHYSREEIVKAGSDFLGVTAEAIGGVIEHIFKDLGAHPTAYIAGTEGAISFVGGVRYGKGVLYPKGRGSRTVYWQGPSVGFDWGGNASRCFTLCYHLSDSERIFQRFPGVDGSAYFVGGLGANYQRADDITLAPIRAGVGLRLGASVGYLAYSRDRHIIPL